MIKKRIPILILFISLFSSPGFGQQTIIKYLSGTGNDNTVSWDFYCTGGRKSGKWTTIPVPSCWELQGFGAYNYGGDENPSSETGIYKYQFKADKQWKNKQVNIVFEGSMTDTKVEINGKLAGKIHQGSFYQFKYDITHLLKFGKANLLKVRVNKMSANASVNNAEREGDFWVFGGIFRPVYLEILPQTNIKRVAINAEANGEFGMQVFLDHVNKNYSVEAAISKVGSNQTLSPVSIPVVAHDTVVFLQKQYQHVDLWSPEFPNLYQVKVLLKDNKGKIVHVINQKFGFRTVELRRHDGFYLNDKKILFKGVDHHSLWPASGRTTSRTLSIKDALLMKEMNMNAVRMSHYPPDIHFLEACDSLGLMVLDELTGWHQYYDDSTGHRLVKEMVVRDVNHPGVVIWDNGNEGGFNVNLDKDFDLYDPQKRVVIHPWEKFNGAITTHYPSYNRMTNIAMYGDAVFFPTELLHGYFDGGSGAGLDDYWNLMERMPHGAGGFLWVFADGGIVRTDKNNIIDVHGDNAPDGILGPYRQKGGSFYTIRQIWSPVQINQKYITPDFNGKLLVKNNYSFTNLDQCTFKWELVRFGDPSDKDAKATIVASGKPLKTSIMPGEQRWMDIQLPSSWALNDALYFTAWDPHHRKLFTWSWPIHTPHKLAEKQIRKSGSAPVVATGNGNLLIVSNGSVKLYFNETTGFLEKVTRNDSTLSLSGGPALAGTEQKLESFSYKYEGKNYIVKSDYKGKNSWLKAEWTFTPGMPVKLAYASRQGGKVDFMGLTFNYPEDKIAGMQWLGRGPFHVWKNRQKGLEFGIWTTEYNNPKGKERWVYPESKGNFKDVYWVKVKTKEIPFTVFIEKQNVFLQMLKPERQIAPSKWNHHININFPEGNIGFMNAIQPIGVKFRNSDELGPQGQKNEQLDTPYEGILWFDFR